jgi:signal transduction histidine kinase
MPDPLLQIADPIVGMVLLVCGAVTWARRPKSRVGLLLVVASGCWFLGSLWSAAVFLHRGPLVHLHLSYPTGRVRRPLTVVTVVAAYVVAVVEGFIESPWLTLGLAVLVAVAAVDVFARTSGKARKAGRPALGAAIAFAGVLALSSANLLLGWDADRPVLLVYDITICAVAVTLTADLLWGRWTDATVADLVTQIGGQTDTAGLQGELRRALGDPTLTVGYWVSEVGRYVDEAGTVVDVGERDGRAVTTVDDGAEPVAVLVHDPAVLDDHALIDGATSALRLAVTNLRMRAQVRAHASELAAARRRIVEAADAQRRALESELAAGAERRLSSVARLLDGVHDRVDESAQPMLSAVRAEVRSAQDGLQEFAQGIRPYLLGSGGLAAAIPALAARATLPIDVDIAVGRLAPAIESAVYFVIAEGLTNIAKHSAAGQAWVRVHVDARDVVARVEDDGVGGADRHGLGLRGLSDRVEALGGNLRIEAANAGGTVLEARIPVGPHP